MRRGRGSEEATRRPAFYAARPGGWRDWWTLLHPPYTAWHLSYVVIGASLAQRPDVKRLVATVLAFFLAVGISAHALDELNGRPLGTRIPSPVLMAASFLGVGGAVAIGVAGALQVGPVLVPFLLLGPFLVVAYNAELFGGIVHTDAGFAAAWGSFPVLTAYVAETADLSVAAVVAAAAAFALSLLQRRLSTAARSIRRKAVTIEGAITFDDGTRRPVDAAELLRPLEGALAMACSGVVLVALALALSRLA